VKYIVLLAAYGYSEYLDCQIKSINAAFKKADSFGEVYLSFDGEYEKLKIEVLTVRSYSNISLAILKGPNAGVNANFLYLSKYTRLKNHGKYCCFFSDHDDIWHKDKVVNYVRLIKNCKDDDFLIFSNSSLFSNSGQFDKDLWSELNYSGQVIRPSTLIKKNYVQGATICASDGIVSLYAKLDQDQIMFDHLLAYIGALRNCIIPFNSMMLLYRIHSDNLIGINHKCKVSLGKLKYFLLRSLYFVYLYAKKIIANEIK
jgi:hypothetical protein